MAVIWMNLQKNLSNFLFNIITRQSWVGRIDPHVRETSSKQNLEKTTQHHVRRDNTKKPQADAKITTALRGGSSRCARSEQVTSAIERSFRKHGFGHSGDNFGCKCLPDVVVQPISEAWREVGASVALGSWTVSKIFQ